MLASLQNHSGQIYGLDFNPFQQHLLATGGANNEVFLWDLQNPSQPSVYTPGSATSPGYNDITSVAWNRKVIHILATATASGAVTIWDLRAKRPVLNFGKNRCKAIAWNPEQPTSIVTASEDDDHPVIHSWNLVNTFAPEKTLSGHTQGVLSLSWCTADTSLLLSTGKDKRTLLWDTTTSELISEVEISANWNFDVQWSPAVPAVASACSLDGKIRVLRLNDFDTRPALAPAVTPLSNGMTQQGMNDLFGLTSSDSSFGAPAPVAQNSHPAEPDTRPAGKAPRRAPNWLRRPAGATFGFGGRLVMFGKPKAPAAGPQTPAAGAEPTKPVAPKTSPVKLVGVVTEEELIRRADYLELAINQNKYQQFCDEKLKAAKTEEEKTTWSFIKATFGEKPRQEFLSHLGFDPEQVSNTLNDYIDTLDLPEGITKGVNDDSDDELPLPAATNSTTLRDNLAEDADPALAFDKAISLAVGSNGAASAPPKPLSPINLSSKDPTDTMLTRALLVGDFPSAVDCCIRLNRMADALVLAACGGGALWKRTQDIYFKMNAKTKPFVAVISSIVNKSMDDLVARVDLARWRECLAVLCTYGAKEQFGSLCSRLGDRLKKETQNMQFASLCYICAGAIEQTLDAWIQTRASASQSLSLMQLQDLIERVVVSSKARSEFKVTEYLVGKYAEYAEALATQGRLSAALYYLQHSQKLAAPAPGSPAAILYDRVFHAVHQRGSVSAKEVPPFPFDLVSVGKGAKPSAPASAAGPKRGATPVASTLPVASHGATAVSRGSRAAAGTRVGAEPPQPTPVAAGPFGVAPVTYSNGGVLPPISGGTVMPVSTGTPAAVAGPPPVPAGPRPGRSKSRATVGPAVLPSAYTTVLPPAAGSMAPPPAFTPTTTPVGPPAPAAVAPPPGPGRAATAPPAASTPSAARLPPSTFVPSAPSPSATTAATPAPASTAAPPKKKKKDGESETPPVKKKKKVAKPIEPLIPASLPPAPVAAASASPARAAAVVPPPKPSSLSTMIPAPVSAMVPASPARADPPPATRGFTTAPTPPPEPPKIIPSEQQELLEKVKLVVARIEAVESLADIHPRIADLNEKLLSVGELARGGAAFACLLKFFDSILNSSLLEAKDALQDLTTSHYRAVGSKAMLGLKRMLSVVEKHRL